MQYRSIFIVAFIFLSAICFGQDQLFKKDNAKLEVKVVEVSPTEIKYKLKSNPNGPLYIINKSDVALIIYENGAHETYPDVKLPQQQITYIEPSLAVGYDSILAQEKRLKEEHFNKVYKTKNVAFVNSLGFFNACVSVSYLREFGNGLFSLHLPVSFSVAEPTISNSFYSGSINYNYNIGEYKITHKAIDVGLGFYFHTSGKRAVTHFIGPLIKFAQYNGSFLTYNYDQYTYTSYPPTKHGFVLNETSFLINNGVLFRITPHFNMMINAAFGFISSRNYVANDPANFPNPYNNYYNNSYNNSPIFNLGFCWGYRF